MRTKPTAARPIIVCKVKHVWRGMFMAYWDDRLNYPRQLSALFRRIDGVWTTQKSCFYAAGLVDAHRKTIRKAWRGLDIKDLAALDYCEFVRVAA